MLSGWRTARVRILGSGDSSTFRTTFEAQRLFILSRQIKPYLIPDAGFSNPEDNVSDHLHQMESKPLPISQIRPNG